MPFFGLCCSCPRECWEAAFQGAERDRSGDLCPGDSARLAAASTVIPNARYVHTNIVARDWRALARFYELVFGCTPVPPERSLAGHEIDAGTGLSGARIAGVHLRLPGFAEAGPTLEIFQYAESSADTARAVNRPGFAHIAFAVESVEAARREVLGHGGSPVGEVVTVTITPTARVTWCYVRDPEGNVLELQSWTGDAGEAHG